MDDFFDKYTVIEEISMQHNAEVLLAYGNKEKKLIVLKIIKNRPLKKLNQEVDIATSFNHENVMTAISAETLITRNGDVCKILKYKRCDCDLFDYFQQIESREVIYDMFLQMARSVEYLHSNNQAHCDIKLENFLVDHRQGDIPKIYLTDFEHLITLKNKKTKKYKPATYIYRPKETFSKRKRKIDAKAVDVFCLGLCFHCILSGCLPYSSGDEEEEKRNIKNGLISIDEELNDDEFDLISGMLETNPKKRITIKEVINHQIFQTLI